MRAVRDAPAFEVEVEGGGPTFAECVSRGIGERLEGAARRAQARDERIEQMHRRMRPSI